MMMQVMPGGMRPVIVILPMSAATQLISIPIIERVCALKDVRK